MREQLGSKASQLCLGVLRPLRVVAFSWAGSDHALESFDSVVEHPPSSFDGPVPATVARGLGQPSTRWRRFAQTVSLHRAR